MSETTELIAQQIMNGNINKRTWGDILYNVKVYGAVGDGIKDDTASIQATIDYAVSVGAKAVFFPHGTYKVTALTNLSSVVLFGDNATFSGISDIINQIGKPPTPPVSLVYNVKDYGAKGDGTDDTAAVNAAIAACPPGGTVFFPTSVKYLLTSTITINKPIKLMGFNKVYEIEGGFEQANILEFSSGVYTGIHVTSYAVSIENLVVKMLDSSASIVAAIHLDTATLGGMRYSRLYNVYTFLNNALGAGIKGRNLIVSSFEKCECFQGQYGFYLYSTGTSVKFDSCWARAQTVGGAGFYANNYTYLSFITTAADSVNNPDYGYQLVGCRGISFNGSGAELMGKAMMKLDNCDGITLDGSFAYNMNQLGTATATFAELVNGSKNIVLTGCVEETSGSSVVPNVRKDSTSKTPVFINCDFPVGYSDNGVALTPPGIQEGAIIPISYPSSLVPAAAAAHRGKIVVVQGDGATTADLLYICLRSATGTYSWKTVTTG